MLGDWNSVRKTKRQTEVIFGNLQVSVEVECSIYLEGFGDEKLERESRAIPGLQLG